MRISLLSIVCLVFAISSNLYAKSINCVGRASEFRIDDNLRQIFVSGKHASDLSELLLGFESMHVDSIIFSTGAGKIVGKYILKVETNLLNHVEAVVFYIDGQSKRVKIDGGFVSASFNPFYDIGLKGSLTVLKGENYKVINLDTNFLNRCLN